MNANWRSEAAQKALIALAANHRCGFQRSRRRCRRAGPGCAVPGQRSPPGPAGLPGASRAARFQRRAVARHGLRTFSRPSATSDFRGDSGRPERKAPDGGWQQWLSGISAKEAGYRKDYEVCADHASAEPIELFCKGGADLPRPTSRGVPVTRCNRRSAATFHATGRRR